MQEILRLPFVHVEGALQAQFLQGYCAREFKSFSDMRAIQPQ